MKPEERLSVSGRLRMEFPRMTFPDDTIEIWYEEVKHYPASLVEQAVRRMARLSDRIPLAMPWST
jgi:hypothetical protein